MVGLCLNRTHSYDVCRKLKVFTVVLNSHTQRWSENLTVLERGGDMILCKYWKNSAHIQRVSTLIVLNFIVHMKSDTQSCVTNGGKKRELERGVQTLARFSPFHSWPITVLSECWIVCFGLLQKWSDHPNATMERCWRKPSDKQFWRSILQFKLVDRLGLGLLG